MSRNNQTNDETESLLKELAGLAKGLSLKASALLVDMPSTHDKRTVVERIMTESALSSRALRGVQ